MSKITEFTINFDSNQQVYYPGSQVSGYVILHLNQPMNMRGLRIEFDGKAMCHWTKEEGTGDEKRTVSYNGNETYFNLVSVLFGNLPNAGSHTFQHPDGRHTYQFNFSLPNPLPSSFEGEFGHIRYILKAQIDKPWRFDYKVKHVVTVNEIIDMNLSHYQVGSGGEEHKTVGCCCWAAGPLDVSTSIDRNGYCPGEVIYINAHVFNKTSRDMRGMKARLYQTIRYNPDGSRFNSTDVKEERRQVGQLKGPEIEKGQRVEWENQPFGIPALPPSIFTSRVITVSYDFQLEVDVPCGFDPCIILPITMGTVPHIPTYGQSVPFYGTPEDPKFAPASNIVHNANYSAPQPGLFGYPDMPPPSYSAVVGGRTVHIGDEDDTNTTGELNYMPVYTFARRYDATTNPPGTLPNQNPSQYPPPNQGSSQYPPPNQNPSQYPPSNQNSSQYPPPNQNQSQYPPFNQNPSQYPPSPYQNPPPYSATPNQSYPSPGPTASHLPTAPPPEYTPTAPPIVKPVIRLPYHKL